MRYMNPDTGVIFTIDELKHIWCHYGYESDQETFEDLLETLEKVEDDVMEEV